MRAPTIDAGLVEERPSKLPRTPSGLNHTDKANMLSIELASATKIALRNVPDTIARATRLCLLLRQCEGSTDQDDRDACNVFVIVMRRRLALPIMSVGI